MTGIIASVHATEPLSSIEDIASYIHRPDAKGTFMRLLSEAAHSDQLFRRLCTNLIKAYLKSPEILTLLFSLDLRDSTGATPNPTEDSNHPTSHSTTLPTRPIQKVMQELLLHLASRQPSSISLIVHSLARRLGKSVEGTNSALNTLMSLLGLVPSSSGIVLSALSAHFPYHMRSKEDHTGYVAVLLEVASRHARWRSSLWELLIARTLILDVESQNYCNNQKESNNDGAAPNEMREKLDAVLSLLFEAVQKALTEGGEMAQEMHSILLNCFQRFILPTGKSHAVQFLLFYAASWSTEFCDQLLGVLFKPLLRFVTALDAGRKPSIHPSATILTSLAYIGSLVTRARFVAPPMLRLTFETLIELYSRLQPRSAGESLATIIAHQAWYLILVRSADLALAYDNVEEEEWGDVLDELLRNPRIMINCPEWIVEGALHIVDEQLGIVDADLVDAYREYKMTLDRQKRRKMEASRIEMLNDHLPFNPMTLERSLSFISPQVYIHHHLVNQAQK